MDRDLMELSRLLQRLSRSSSRLEFEICIETAQTNARRSAKGANTLATALGGTRRLRVGYRPELAPIALISRARSPTTAQTVIGSKRSSSPRGRAQEQTLFSYIIN
jgi:hypothetical protein